MEILHRAFGLNYERFCSPLNFCPLFHRGSTIGDPDLDGLWGFDHDAFLQSWSDDFGIFNPEWSDAQILKSIKTAQHATYAAKAVRNMAILPYNDKFPLSKTAISSYHPNKTVLAIFQPGTFAFTPYQVLAGERSHFGLKPYKGALALVSWENKLATPPHPEDLASLGMWCRDKLQPPPETPKAPTVMWGESMGPAALGQHNPQTDFKAPIHHSWHELAREMTPADD